MKTQASHFRDLGLKLLAILFAAPLVSNAQLVSPCHPVADTSQREFAVSSAFDGTNFLIALRGHTGSSDLVGAQLLSPGGSRVGGFIDTGRAMDGFLDGPRVAFGGSNYLMAWTDAASQHPASDNDVYARFIYLASSSFRNFRNVEILRYKRL